MAGIKVPTDAYCEIQAVNEHLPKRTYDAQSVPTASQVEQQIINIAAEINAVLRGLGYTVPITNTEDHKILSRINSLGAAWYAENATLSQVPGADRSVVEALRIEFERMMKNLRDGFYQFVSGSPTVNNPEVNTDLVSGTRSEPIFTMEELLTSTKF